MNRELKVIDAIQSEKSKEINKAEGPQELDPEWKKVAEHKRETFDIIDVPVDPLR